VLGECIACYICKVKKRLTEENDFGHVGVRFTAGLANLGAIINPSYTIKKQGECPVFLGPFLPQFFTF
jgi:hypothetical protein